MIATGCTCTWTLEHGVPTMTQRDEDCDHHGADSAWWRRVQRRAQRLAGTR